MLCKSKPQITTRSYYYDDTNNMAIIAINTEVDETKLGKWDWIRYREKDNFITKIITVYISNNPVGWGYRKVYYKHQRTLTRKNITTCSLEILWKDSWKVVDTCQEKNKNKFYHLEVRTIMYVMKHF